MRVLRAAGGRGRPRLWHYDYLHLRPLARDLRDRLSGLPPRSRTILDLGSGGSPYADAAGSGATWIRGGGILDEDEGPGGGGAGGRRQRGSRSARRSSATSAASSAS